MAIRITVAEPITVQAVASLCGSYFCSRSLSRLGPFALPRAAGRRSPRLRERRPGEPSPGMPAAGVTPDWVDAAWRPCGGFRPGAPALRKQPVGSASMARRWTPSEDVALRLAAALDWEHGGVVGHHSRCFPVSGEHHVGSRRAAAGELARHHVGHARPMARGRRVRLDSRGWFWHSDGCPLGPPG